MPSIEGVPLLHKTLDGVYGIFIRAANILAWKLDLSRWIFTGLSIILDSSLFSVRNQGTL